MSSYWRSIYPAISWKLHSECVVSATRRVIACRTKNVRELVVNVVTKAGGVDNRQRDSYTVLLELCGVGQRQWALSGPLERSTHRH